MKIRINEGDLHLISLRTRMPFKYGIATMTEMPMMFVRVHLDINGRQSLGIAADLLPPKWFTKDPAKPVDEEIKEMILVIRNALSLAINLSGDSPFTVWKELYERQFQWGRSQNVPPLLANFGTSLVERAMIEAYCRGLGSPFHKVLLGDKLGIQLDHIHSELKDRKPADFLPAQPLSRIIARHTVGLTDPLFNHEIKPADKLSDGLPQSLADCIHTYGLRHFKIKINGHLDSDTERLHHVAEVIEKHARADFAFTLDGNEQFRSLRDFQIFWDAISASDKLKDFLKHLIFVEQPLHRSEALDPGVGQALAEWSGHPPLIIDESDATIESLPKALELGYNGTSHKNAKGIFKGIANRCLLAHRQREHPEKHFLMSGEDLCNVGPVALLQDLNVMAALGIESVERNGHHYNAGLSQFPQTVQEQVLKAHPDLYHASPAGWPTLTIKEGGVSLGSVNESPFGVRFLLDASQFTPLENRLFESDLS